MLRLRAIEPSDADLFYTVENDEASWGASDTVAPWSRHALLRYAASYAADPFADGQLRLIAEAPEAGAVGILDFYELSPLHARAWVGIYILPEHRRKGYATRILEMASSYAKSRLGLHMLGARIPAGNDISLSTFGKAGYTPCGLLPEWHFASGRRHDLHIYIKRL